MEECVCVCARACVCGKRGLGIGCWEEEDMGTRWGECQTVFLVIIKLLSEWMGVFFVAVVDVLGCHLHGTQHQIAVLHFSTFNCLSAPQTHALERLSELFPFKRSFSPLVNSDVYSVQKVVFLFKKRKMVIVYLPLCLSLYIYSPALNCSVTESWANPAAAGHLLAGLLGLGRPVRTGKGWVGGWSR